MNPLVSICCLAYNHEKLISDALNGFLMQEAAFPYEIVVHDDASTDSTPDIIRQYQRNNPGLIRAIFQTENQLSKTGIYPFVTHLYPTARGKYIADCDGDDYWTDPLKLQRQVDFLEANPGYSMCYHDLRMHFVDVNRMVAAYKTTPPDYSELELIGFRGNWLHPSTKMWRNVFDADTKQDFEAFCGDYALNVLMGMYGKCKYIAGIKPSVFRRNHGGNSWCCMTPTDTKMKTNAMFQRLYDFMVAKGNPQYIAIRKEFLGKA